MRYPKHPAMRALVIFVIAGLAITAFVTRTQVVSDSNAASPAESTGSDPRELVLSQTTVAISADGSETVSTVILQTFRWETKCSVQRYTKGPQKGRPILGADGKPKRTCKQVRVPISPIDPTVWNDSPTVLVPSKPVPRLPGDPTPTPTPTPTLTPTPTPKPTPEPSGDPRAYAFIAADEGSGIPARWDRCSPIRYRVNTANIPSNGMHDIRQALQQLTEASGYEFDYVGETDVIPYTSTDWYKPLYGPGMDTDLYIAFASEATVPGLGGNIVGLGGPLWIDDGPNKQDPRIVFGGVTLDFEARLEPGFQRGRSWGALLLHEFGHATNLAHVEDQVQIMYPALIDKPRARFELGDRNGLAYLQSFPCFP